MKVLLPKHEFDEFDKTNLEKAAKQIKETEITDLTKEDAHYTVYGKLDGPEYIKGKVLKHPVPNSLWMESPLAAPMKPHDRDRYEWFVAGFLYYYDAEVRNNAVDHHIYFKWESDKVRIYMNPPPLLPIPDQSSVPANGVTTDPPRPPQAPPPPKGNT